MGREAMQQLETATPSETSLNDSLDSKDGVTELMKTHETNVSTHRKILLAPKVDGRKVERQRAKSAC